MNKFFKSTITFTCTSLLAFGLTFKMQERKAQTDDNLNQTFDYQVDEVPQTNQQKLLSSLISMNGFNVNGGINFTLQDQSIIKIGLDVTGDISNLEDISVKGDINLNLNGLVIPASLGYFNSTMYFNYRENFFRLETQNLLDFVHMLPDYGVQIELPSELENLDLNTITTLINSMEEKDGVNGEKYFVLNLSDNLNLYVKTDSEYNFKGIRTDHILYSGMDFYLDLDLVKTPIDQLNLISPVDDGTYAKYQDFKPVFNIFKGLYNTFKGTQNTINISVHLEKKNEDIYEDMLNASLDLSYDLNNKLFTLGGEIDENNREHNFDLAYENQNIYVHMNNFKMAITTESIGSIVSYVLDRVASQYMDTIMDSISDMLNSSELIDTISNIDSLLKDIHITENSFSIDLDTEAFNLGMGTITPTINFTGEHLDSIVINGIAFNDMKLGISISPKTYTPVHFNAEEYVQFDPALTIVDAIIPLIDQKDFRIEFDAKVEDTEGVKEDIDIEGGLQFNIEDNFGFGQVTITDRDLYKHNIKADMKSPEEILFSYNDTMNGKFKIDTMKELLDLVKDIVANPDEHFMELFGSLLDSLEATPITKVMDGDIGAIFDEEIINSISVTDTSTKLDISLGIVGLKDNNVTFEIFYSNDGENAYLDGLSIDVSGFEGLNIELNARLEKYSVEHEVERLDPYAEYMDFSDIRVLLELGINTSKFDYFHFTSIVDLKIPLIGSLKIDKKIPLDIQIRNNHGDVQVEAEFSDIPVISLVNNNGDYNHTKSRTASLFYQDGLFYLKRVDQVDKKILFIGKNYEVTYSAVYDTDYFLENVLQILLGDLFGMGESIMNMIVDSTAKDDDNPTQIEYEKILRQFAYYEEESKFVVKVDLNALTHKDMLDTIDLVVFEDKETKQLSGIKVSLAIHVLLTISINLDLQTVSKEPLSESNVLTSMNTWIASHNNDQLNNFAKISEVQK